MLSHIGLLVHSESEHGREPFKSEIIAGKARLPPSLRWQGHARAMARQEARPLYALLSGSSSFRPPGVESPK